MLAELGLRIYQSESKKTTKLELLSEQGCLGAAIQAIIEHTVKQQVIGDEQQKHEQQKIDRYLASKVI